MSDHAIKEEWLTTRVLVNETANEARHPSVPKPAARRVSTVNRRASAIQVRESK